jgi:hypothetical protein
LQVGHVVTALHGRPPVEEAVTQPETGFHQGVPRLLSADAIDPEPPEVLKRFKSGPGPGAEDAVGIDGAAGENGGESVLNVRDRLPAVARGEGKAYRYAEISSRS